MASLRASDKNSREFLQGVINALFTEKELKTLNEAKFKLPLQGGGKNLSIQEKLLRGLENMVVPQSGAKGGARPRRGAAAASSNNTASVVSGVSSFEEPLSFAAEPPFFAAEAPSFEPAAGPNGRQVSPPLLFLGNSAFSYGAPAAAAAPSSSSVLRAAEYADLFAAPPPAAAEAPLGGIQQVEVAALPEPRLSLLNRARSHFPTDEQLQSAKEAVLNNKTRIGYLTALQFIIELVYPGSPTRYLNISKYLLSLVFYIARVLPGFDELCLNLVSSSGMFVENAILGAELIIKLGVLLLIFYMTFYIKENAMRIGGDVLEAARGISTGLMSGNAGPLVERGTAALNLGRRGVSASTRITANVLDRVTSSKIAGLLANATFYSVDMLFFIGNGGFYYGARLPLRFTMYAGDYLIVSNLKRFKKILFNLGLDLPDSIANRLPGAIQEQLVIRRKEIEESTQHNLNTELTMYKRKAPTTAFGRAERLRAASVARQRGVAIENIGAAQALLGLPAALPVPPSLSISAALPVPPSLSISAALPNKARVVPSQVRGRQGMTASFAKRRAGSTSRVPHKKPNFNSNQKEAEELNSEPEINKKKGGSRMKSNRKTRKQHGGGLFSWLFGKKSTAVAPVLLEAKPPQIGPIAPVAAAQVAPITPPVAPNAAQPPMAQPPMAQPPMAQPPMAQQPMAFNGLPDGVQNRNRRNAIVGGSCSVKRRKSMKRKSKSKNKSRSRKD
jgi:hypothetical protein